MNLAPAHPQLRPLDLVVNGKAITTDVLRRLSLTDALATSCTVPSLTAGQLVALYADQRTSVTGGAGVLDGYYAQLWLSERKGTPGKQGQLGAGRTLCCYDARGELKIVLQPLFASGLWSPPPLSMRAPDYREPVRAGATMTLPDGSVQVWRAEYGYAPQ